LNTLNLNDVIIVIADDFTGAAELGGIGLRYKLGVEINTEINTSSKADLLIIAADARSVDEASAVKQMEALTRAAKKMKPSLLYKKTDSVMRGHIVPEIAAQLKALQLQRALLVPANPALGRTIQDGKYYIYGKPVHETSFATDPEFPVGSADVCKMLRSATPPVHVIKPAVDLPSSGILVGEVKSSDDLKTWAARVDDSILAAGGAGFFAAILDRMKLTGTPSLKINGSKEPVSQKLFICGSTFNKSVESILHIKDNGGPVSYMPATVFLAKNNKSIEYGNWSDEVAALIQTHGRAIVAIDADNNGTAKISAVELRERMAALVKQVMDKTDIKELFIEGGSTTAAVLRKLQLHTFVPVKEMASGVIKMSAPERPGLLVTVKPGSYNWPVEIWVFKERI
jgi:D-threonate/D-erythronate kinase